MNEEIVRESLGLSPGDRLRECGTYRAPDPHDEAPDVTDEERIRALFQTEVHFQEEPRLGAVLHCGHVKRWHADPALVLFEGLPEPVETYGRAYRLTHHRWVLSSRPGPGGLVVPSGDGEIVFWGENAQVRVFRLQRLTHADGHEDLSSAELAGESEASVAMAHHDRDLIEGDDDDVIDPEDLARQMLFGATQTQKR